MDKKTDNHNPEVKLKLRKYFLEKYHANGSAKVFDCCQGGGVMWTTIQQTHAVESYWGVDVKPKKGRVKIDSIRVLQQSGLKQDVIDIDTYGSPWKHWFAMLPNIVRPTTVFLTIGSCKVGGSALSTEARAVLEIGNLQIPKGIGFKLNELAVDHCLSAGTGFCTIVEAVESVSTGNARYIGVRLEPKKDGQHVSDADRQNTSVERN